MVSFIKQHLDFAYLFCILIFHTYTAYLFTTCTLMRKIPLHNNLKIYDVNFFQKVRSHLPSFLINISQ